MNVRDRSLHQSVHHLGFVSGVCLYPNLLVAICFFRAYAFRMPTHQYLEHVWAPGTTPDGYTLLCGLDRLARRHKPILKPIWAHYAVRPGRL